MPGAPPWPTYASAACLLVGGIIGLGICDEAKSELGEVLRLPFAAMGIGAALWVGNRISPRRPKW